MKEIKIAVVNQKGGVGKTTTAFNLANELSNLGKKVLLVDLDPQANLTMCLGNDQPDELEHTVHELILNEMEEIEYDIDDYIIKEKIDYIPSNIFLAAVEMKLITALNRERLLEKALKRAEGRYDYVIIDCMPSLSSLIINALCVADEVLITSSAQYLSVKGLELLLKTIVKVRKNLNDRLTIKGILITMYRQDFKANRHIVETTEAALSQYAKIFKTKIPRSIKVDEANYDSKSVSDFEKNNKVAIAYKAFAKEFISS